VTPRPLRLAAALAAALALPGCALLFGRPAAPPLAGAPPLVEAVYQASRQGSWGRARPFLNQARALVDGGADPDARGPFARSALHWAAIGAVEADDKRRDRAYRELAERLLAAGADVNAEDAYGNTALDWAEGDAGGDLLQLLATAGGRHGVSRHLSSSLDRLLYVLYQALDADDLATARELVGSGIRPGTVLTVRLESEVSSVASRAGDPVDAITVAPVESAGRVVVPPGTPVEGTVLYAKPVAGQYSQAELSLDFANLVHDDGARTRIVSIVTDVDNAREVVRDNRIIGIPFATHKEVFDWGVRMLGLLPFVGVATDTALYGFARTINRDIVYEPGTEMTVQVRLPVRFDQPMRGAAWPVLAPSPELVTRVRALPLQARTKSGLASDVTNIVVLGSREAILETFAAAGWVEAASLGVSSGFKTFLATLRATDYDEGPFAPLFLDGERQELELQKQTNTYAKRHHVRLWRRGTLHGRALWVGCGTHDIGLRIRRAGTDWPHIVHPRIDIERSKILHDLMFSGRAEGYTLVPRPAAAGQHDYEDEGRLITDGAVLVVRLAGGSAPSTKGR